MSVVLCIVAAPFCVSQSSPTSVVSELPRQAKPISEVVVPIPSEVFESLDKFSNANWRLVQLDGLARAKPHGDQTQIALLLGVVIGEGFIAVEAHDAAEVKEVGSAVFTLARGLGVQPTVVRRSQSIVEHADKNDWTAVRREWDGVLPDVQEGMKQLKSEQLSQLVSLGGWLRGTKALTALILQRYSPNDAELLRQPALLDRFEKQLSEMTPNASVSKMREGVRQMRALVASASEPISENSVRGLSAVCGELLGIIRTGQYLLENVRDPASHFVLILEPPLPILHLTPEIRAGVEPKPRRVLSLAAGAIEIMKTIRETVDSAKARQMFSRDAMR